jgi:hypothetical protein
VAYPVEATVTIAPPPAACMAGQDDPVAVPGQPDRDGRTDP